MAMRRMMLAVGAAVLAALPALAGPDWKETEKKANDYLKQGTPQGNQQACDVLRQDGSAKAAQKLIDLIKRPVDSRQEEAEIAAIDKWLRLNNTYSSEEDRKKLLENIAKKQQEKEAIYARVLAKEQLSVHAADALKGFTDREVITKVFYKALSDANTQVREAVADSLGALKDEYAVEHLVKLLKDKKPGPRVAAARALATIGDAEAAGPALIDAFNDKGNPETVRTAFGHALADLKVYKAIPHLIAALEKADGRFKMDLDEILFKLTKSSMVGDYKSWNIWLDANREAIDSGSYQPPAESIRKRGEEGRDTTFFDIPVNSKRLIFVIDVSGSMQAPMAEQDVEITPPPGVRTPPVKLGKDRISVAQYELVQVIRKLPEDAVFTIIPFNDTVQEPLFPQMVKASPSIKAQAEDKVLKLKANGGTNIYEALRAGFFLAGNVATDTDKYYEVSVDTIYFLTDGQPEHGPVTKWEDILKEVENWNRNRGVKVHTIEIGQLDQIRQLQAQGQNVTTGCEALAHITGGNHVKR